MIYIVIAIGVFFIILERIIPDQKLPHVKGWWMRVVIINLIQLAVVFIGSISWEEWLKSFSLFSLAKEMHPIAGGLLSYLIITFVFYWWHRWRHDVNWFWLMFHQVHHSPQRIETVTSFYKHPLEIVLNSVIIGIINYILLGLTLEAAAWTLLFVSVGEYFYHMNIRTPHFLGYFFQRPEMHRIHHQLGKHYNNFSDLPLWDMLFGTFENPRDIKTACGFKAEREVKLLDMLFFRNVNKPYSKKKVTK